MSGSVIFIIGVVSHAPSAPPVHAAVRELFGETADCKYIHTYIKLDGNDNGRLVAMAA